jgi:hypothetical protein
MKLESSLQSFEKLSNTKFHENLPNGSRVDPRGRTEMTKLTGAFHNFFKDCKVEKISDKMAHKT